MIYTKPVTITWADETGSQSFTLSVDALNAMEAMRLAEAPIGGAAKYASVVERVRDVLNRQYVIAALQLYMPSVLQTAFDAYETALGACITDNAIRGS